MTNKREKRGRYMDDWSRKSKRERMSLVAKSRWAKLTPEERKALAMKMVEARKNKKITPPPDATVS